MSSTAEAPTRPVRVLLVDDTEDLRRLTAFVLEQRGDYLIVAEAADGVDGIRQARDHQPDLVLLDVSMPGMDGLEALPHIREAAPDAVVVMLSGFLGERLADTAIAQGAAAYLEKGLPPGELVARIDAALTGAVRPPAATPKVEPLGDDELHAVIAHDLRGSLGAIIGFGATAELSWERFSDEQRRDIVRRMTRQAKILQNVTDNLLAGRALELGAVSVEHQVIDYRSYLLACRDDLAPLAAHHNLVAEVDEDVELVIADGARLRQVLGNLIGNAARFAPESTTIRLRGWRDATGTIVSVADEGPGIPLAHREQVFERHVRLGASQGIGLGLYVCAELVGAMDGAIWIGDPPVGAEVCVRVPTLPA